MLRAEGLHVYRRGRPVLSDIDLTVQPGQVVGVLGANGAGKSTLLAALSGEVAPRQGRVTLDGAPLAGLSAAAQARRRAVLPQHPSLSFDLHVRDVVGMGAYPFPELPVADVRHLVSQALALADCEPLSYRRYLDLSGGEQQRVHFARALVQVLAGQSPGGPTCYLLLDEPTSGQDPPHQGELLRCTHALSRQYGLGALVVLHDVNLAARWCDRLLLLAGGGAVVYDSPSRALTPENLGAVYGMTARVVPHPLEAGRPWVFFD